MKAFVASLFTCIFIFGAREVTAFAIITPEWAAQHNAVISDIKEEYSDEDLNFFLQTFIDRHPQVDGFDISKTSIGESWEDLGLGPFSYRLSSGDWEFWVEGDWENKTLRTLPVPEYYQLEWSLVTRRRLQSGRVVTHLRQDGEWVDLREIRTEPYEVEVPALEDQFEFIYFLPGSDRGLTIRGRRGEDGSMLVESVSIEEYISINWL